MSWKTGVLAEIAADAGKLRDAIDTSADTMNRTIHGLDWSGQAFNAAATRADREKSEQRAVATAYDDLATALAGAERDTGYLIGQIQQTVHSLPHNWSVAEDFTVTSPDSADKNAAQNETIGLQGYAGQLGQAMDDSAKKITAAINDISTTAPESAEKCVVNPADKFTAQQARTDLQALRDGTADAEALARLHAATDLSQAEKDTLAKGQTVSLASFDYLQSLSQGMNGMSGEDIADLGSKLPGNGHDQVQAAIANDFRIVSNPQVYGAGLDGKWNNSGGMKQLPDTVRNALQDSPVKSIPFGSHTVNNWDDLRGVGQIMSNGDKAIQGSDIDRGMIKQGAELAAAAGPNTYFDTGTDNVSKVANNLLDNASGDHAAIHDAVLADPNSTSPGARDAAERMGVTCNDGGKYFGSQHVVDILQHQWAPDQHGAENAFKWIGEDASLPKDSYLNNQAGQTAYGLASILGDSNNQHVLNSPDNPLGAYNPRLTQTLANSMSPYLGNFAGVTDHDLLNSTPVDNDGHPLNLPVNSNPAQLSNMLSVLDSDPQAARTINSAGMQWHDALEYAAGVHPDKSGQLLGDASSLQGAMNTGLATDINAHAAERAYHASQEYADKGVFADGVTSAVQTVGAIGGGPVGGPVVGGIAATVDSYIKADVISNPSDPAHPLPDDNVSSALNAIKSETTPDSIRDEYLETQGYVSQHPDAAHYFNQQGGGNLINDWHNVATGDGTGLNEWRDDYSQFSYDANHDLHRNAFPLQDNSTAPITESDIAPRGEQKPPGASK